MYVYIFAALGIKFMLGKHCVTQQQSFKDILRKLGVFGGGVDTLYPPNWSQIMVISCLSLLGAGVTSVSHEACILYVSTGATVHTCVRAQALWCYHAYVEVRDNWGGGSSFHREGSRDRTWVGSIWVFFVAVWPGTR